MSHGETDDRVWVLDSPALIKIKDIYSPTKAPDPVRLSAAPEHVSTLLQAGQVAFPRQVREELNRYKDKEEMLAVWSRQNVQQQVHQQPQFESVAEVVSLIPNIQDIRKQSEDADPWIVAHALELHRTGYAVSVVSEDINDRPWTTSIRTACAKFELDFVHTRSFLNHIGAPES